jgi:transporter family protein
LISAAFASATAILAKIGIEGVPSNLATAIRTVVVLVFAWAIALALGEHKQLAHLSSKSWVFLGLSGIATGCSWLAYYRALQLGSASQVAPVDKLSVALTVVLAFTVLGETFSWRTTAGAVLIVLGTLLTIR